MCARINFLLFLLYNFEYLGKFGWLKVFIASLNSINLSFQIPHKANNSQFGLDSLYCFDKWDFFLKTKRFR